MFALIPTNQFKKDYKKCLKRKCIEQKIIDVLTYLSETGTVPDKYKPHKLSGNYKGFWECHIESDWLLIWELLENEIKLVRTGTHSDLFK